MKKLLAFILACAMLTMGCAALEIELDTGKTVSAGAVVSAAMPAPSVSATAAVGTQTNPLISLSYLSGTVVPGLESAVRSYAKSSFAVYYADFFYEASQAVAERNLRSVMADGSVRVTNGSIRLKKDDVITLSAGSSFTVQSGSGFAIGGLSNVTAGTAVGDGDWLPLSAGCMAAEDGRGFVVQSDTMQVVVNGAYSLSASSQPDYNSTADALKAMGLFRGDSTGYALERTATRTEALVMFIRLLGEEDEAMASTASHPFTDVASWAEKYVAYAYSKGYTTGVSADKFGSDSAVTARDYLTFIMRALKYSETTDFGWSSAVDDATRLGLLNYSEAAVVGSSFLRAHVAYVSYYSLFAKVKGTGMTLLQTLQESGTVTAPARSAALVVGRRIGS